MDEQGDERKRQGCSTPYHADLAGRGCRGSSHRDGSGRRRFSRNCGWRFLLQLHGRLRHARLGGRSRRNFCRFLLCIRAERSRSNDGSSRCRRLDCGGSRHRLRGRNGSRSHRSGGGRCRSHGRLDSHGRSRRSDRRLGWHNARWSRRFGHGGRRHGKRRLRSRNRRRRHGSSRSRSGSNARRLRRWRRSGKAAGRFGRCYGNAGLLHRLGRKIDGCCFTRTGRGLSVASRRQDDAHSFLLGFVSHIRLWLGATGNWLDYSISQITPHLSTSPAR